MINNMEWEMWGDYEEELCSPSYVKITIQIPVEVRDTKTGKVKFSKEEKKNSTVNIPVHKPWSKTVAGITFSEDYQITKDDIGKDLELVPDFDNPYDSDAIQIHFNGKKLGFCCQGIYKQWTATKLKKLMELGFKIKAKVLSVNGGIPEFEQCKTKEELLKVFLDKYILQFEKTFNIHIIYPPLPSKPEKVSLLRQELNNDDSLTTKEKEKRIKNLKKEWDEYNKLYDNLEKEKELIHDRYIKEILETKSDIVDELWNYIQKNKYSKIKKLTGINIKNKGVNYSLLVLHTPKTLANKELKEQKQQLKKEKEQKESYKNINVSKAQMGFYID